LKIEIIIILSLKIYPSVISSNSISLQFSLYIKRWLYPFCRPLVIIGALVWLCPLFIFVRRDAERNPNLYCGHNKAFYLFTLVVDWLEVLLFLCALGVGEVGLMWVGVVFESLGSAIEGLVLSEGQLRVHLPYFRFDGIVKVGIVYWGRSGFLLSF
jgi:hypothetical protein